MLVQFSFTSSTIRIKFFISTTFTLFPFGISPDLLLAFQYSPCMNTVPSGDKSETVFPSSPISPSFPVVTFLLLVLQANHITNQIKRKVIAVADNIRDVETFKGEEGLNNIKEPRRRVIIPEVIKIPNVGVNAYLDGEPIASNNYFPNYKYKKQIDIYEHSGNNLTDYQMNISIDTTSLISEGKMNSDCSDIRFTSIEEWKYKLPVTIQENSGNDLTNYQIKVELTNSSVISHINPDCSDIRVYDGDKKLPYWIEKCDTTNDDIIFWTKINITANSQKTIYIHYGNPGAVV